jgi:hypothetical protein
MVNTMNLPENVRAYFQRQGKIGAARRLEVVTPERRAEIARKAAITRWAKQAKNTAAKTNQSRKGTK